MQAEREAAGKAAAAAEEESARLKKKLQEAAEELEEAIRRHLADQQRVQVNNAAIKPALPSFLLQRHQWWSNEFFSDP